MNWLSIDELYIIHAKIIEKAGSTTGIRDFSLLHSALERPKASYEGIDLYPSLFLKAAALLHSLCMNHPFIDGNKRTSWISTKRFLKINGYYLTAQTNEAVSFIISVSHDHLELKDIASWLKKYSSLLT